MKSVDFLYINAFSIFNLLYVYPATATMGVTFMSDFALTQGEKGAQSISEWRNEKIMRKQKTIENQNFYLNDTVCRARITI